MTLDELSWAISLGAFLAGLVGWILHWLWCLVARAASGERARIQHLVAELDAAAQAREDAEAARADTEVALTRRIAELEIALEDQEARHAAELEARAFEHARALDQATRDAQAAWDGLGNARRRIAELERTLEGG